VTAEDVGMTLGDMVSIRERTGFVSGLPVDGAAAGGDPGPFTAEGIFLGIEAAVRRRLGRDLEGVHVAIQGAGSVGGGLARRLAARGARLTLADVSGAHVHALAEELGAAVVPTDRIMTVEADVFSPNALGAIWTRRASRSWRHRSSRAAPTTSSPRPPTAPACRRAASSMRPIMSSTPAASSMSGSNISARATAARSSGGSR
jgi:leucine dehydrogenase